MMSDFDKGGGRGMAWHRQQPPLGPITSIVVDIEQQHFHNGYYIVILFWLIFNVLQVGTIVVA